MKKNEIVMNEVQSSLSLGILLYRSRRLFVILLVIIFAVGLPSYSFLPKKNSFNLYLYHDRMVLDSLDAYVNSFSSITTQNSISSNDDDFKARRIVSDLDMRSNFALLNKLYLSFPDSFKKKYSPDYFYSFFANNVSVEVISGQWIHSLSSSNLEFMTALHKQINSQLNIYYSKIVDEYISSNVSFYERYIQNFLSQPESSFNMINQGDQNIFKNLPNIFSEKFFEQEVEIRRLKSVISGVEKPSGSLVSVFQTSLQTSPPIPMYLAIILLLVLSFLLWILSTLTIEYIKEIKKIEQKHDR